MESRSIYHDIARRTDGDIYIGVVGPVRTGKSTFIKRFMETLVLPNIDSQFRRERAVDELPQSAAGRTIMTTEPKFIPEDAVEIQVDDQTSFRVRMIDCVGYILPSSIGYIENEQPRMVQTPWFSGEIPFNMAAEIGTQKVITEHSTIGLVVTTDGSISDIPRSEYQEAEERVIRELKEIEKPFVVLLNSTMPRSAQVQELRQELEEKYQVPVVAVSCLDLTEEDIREILSQVLYQFPVKEIAVEMPKWIVSLENGHWLKKELFEAIAQAAKNVVHISQIKEAFSTLSECPRVDDAQVRKFDLGRGSARVTVHVKPELFYEVLEEATGLDIGGEEGLVPCLAQLAKVKKDYDRIQGALEEVAATGYGIVMPSMEELTLEEDCKTGRPVWCKTPGIGAVHPH